MIHNERLLEVFNSILFVQTLRQYRERCVIELDDEGILRVSTTPLQPQCWARSPDLDSSNTQVQVEQTRTPDKSGSRLESKSESESNREPKKAVSLVDIRPWRHTWQSCNVYISNIHP